MAAPMGSTLLTCKRRLFTLKSFGNLCKLNVFQSHVHYRNASSWRSRIFGSKGDDSDLEEVEAQENLTKLESQTDVLYKNHSFKRRVGLNTTRGYKPPPDVAEKVVSVTEGIVGSPVSPDFHLGDRLVKFQVLTTLMKEFDHIVPNTVLTEMNSLSDVTDYFATPVRDSNAFEDLATLNLPKNLHIQMEPVRFDPETDTFFDGKTAFPGRPTVVTGLRYRRKYKGNSGESRNQRSVTNYEMEKQLEEDRQKYRVNHLPSEGIEREPNYKHQAETEVPVIR